MARLMAVSLTEDAVRDRTKTVTRRLGWTFLKPGDRLQLCRKVMGRKHADGTVEPLERIALVEVVSVRRERLDSLFLDSQSDYAACAREVAREGFPGKSPEWFVRFFREHMHCTPDTVVTRIEWRYLEEGTDA